MGAVDFLSDDDRRTIELVDRIYNHHAVQGASDYDIRMRMAEAVPGTFWPIRARVSAEQFDVICANYPGVAGFATVLKRFTKAVLEEPIHQAARHRDAEGDHAEAAEIARDTDDNRVDARMSA